jgi:WD40 repeat protein
MVWKLVQGGQAREVCKLQGHCLGVSGVSFSPNDKYLATACSDGTMRIWDVTTGTLMRKWDGSNKKTESFVLGGSAEENSSVSYFLGGGLAETLMGGLEEIKSAVWTSDVSGAGDGFVRVWRVDMQVCMHACMCVCVRERVWRMDMQVCMHACTFAWICVCACMCAYVCVCMHIYIYI